MSRMPPSVARNVSSEDGIRCSQRVAKMATKIEAILGRRKGIKRDNLPCAKSRSHYFTSPDVASCAFSNYVVPFLSQSSHS